MDYLRCEQSETFHFLETRIPSLGMFYALLSLNQHAQFELEMALEKTIVSVIEVFSLCRNYLPLENGMAHHMNKLEFPLPTDAQRQLRQIKFSQGFWRRIILIIFNTFSLCRIYLSLEKDVVLHFDKFDIGQIVLKKEI